MLLTTLDLQESGWWVLNVVVSRGGEEAVLNTKLQVAPASQGLAVIWPFVLFPPIAVGLFAIHQMLRRSKLGSNKVWGGTN